ncbi:MAG: tetratricopeptide repeat protein [Pyrinomonadaceae bacterium]
MRKKITSKFVTTSLLIAAFFALTVGINAQNKKDLRKAQKLTTDGSKAFVVKNYRLAIDKYAEAIVAVPNYAEAHFWKGYAHYYLNEYDQALTEINLAAGQNYNKPLEIYKLRWFLNYQKNSYDEALADVQKGLQLEPNNLTLLVALGDISRAKKDYRTALDAYKKASQMTQVSGDILYFIADSAQGTGDVQEQGTSAAAAIKKGTKYVGESYYLLGDSLQKSGKTKEALEAYQQALASKDDIYNVYRAMSGIYGSQNRYKEAIAISNKGLNFFPNDGNINTDLSWYYSLDNSPFKAIQAAEAAIKVLPEESLAYTNLCRAYNDTKQYALAITSCNKALEISPNDGETNFYLGFAYASTNKPNEATKYYQKSVKGLEEFTRENPDYSDGFYLLGNAYTSNSEYENAVKAYTKCLEMSPRFSKARYNLATLYKFLKKDDLALEQYEALVGLDANLAAKLKKEVLDKK